MPPLTDPAILAQFQLVLDNWNYTDYVTAKPIVLNWIAKNLGGLGLKHVAKAMNDSAVPAADDDPADPTIQIVSIHDA